MDIPQPSDQCFSQYHSNPKKSIIAPYIPVKKRLSPILKLPIFRTAVADVAMRKNSTVREMVNIPNGVKILGDKDVEESKTGGTASSL